MTRRVLVIDDDARVRTAFGELLSSTTDLVVAASVATASEACTAAESAEPFDLAVVDIRLPDPATGLALIRRLARQVPVVAVSISSAHRTAALTAGATSFLDKEGRPDTLLAALRAAINLKRRALR